MHAGVGRHTPRGELGRDLSGLGLEMICCITVFLSRARSVARAAVVSVPTTGPPLR